MEKELDGVQAGDFILVRRSYPYSRAFMVRHKVLRTTKTLVYTDGMTFLRDGHHRGGNFRTMAYKYAKEKDQTEKADLFYKVRNAFHGLERDAIMYMESASVDELTKLQKKLSTVVRIVRKKAP